MGSCMGRCFLQTDNNRFLPRQSSGLEFSFLIEDDIGGQNDNKRGFLSRFFSKKKTRKKPVLEFVDEILNPHVPSYSRLSESRPASGTSLYNSKDIPLQCLDARALLARTNMSTPASSLDLEWEHETLPVSMIQDQSASSWDVLPGEITEHDKSETSTRNIPNTDSDWSRVSSVNSLEWDSVPNSFQPSPPVSEVDTDTQQLLSEIERLTSQTLKETGRNWLS